jgi:hypothetical protein
LISTSNKSGPLGSLGPRLPLALFALILVVGWFCYRPALNGEFELDDLSNLGGLAAVDSKDAFWDFVLSGEAGPLGRPVALASFALQADEWSEGAGAFLQVNVLIHLLNGVALACCLYGLARLRSLDRTRSTWVAVAAAGLWLLLPILATSSLLVVQRMTTLSATFLLLGLAVYLHARRRVSESPKRALAGMSAGLVLGTLLSALTKESGLLLPLYVLVIECTLLRQPDSLRPRHWRSWQALFLYAPTLAILAYLAAHAGYSDALVLRRGFSAWERVLTESGILWQYVSRAAVGLPGRLGVFQGTPEVAHSLADPATLPAFLSWPILVGLAIYRRRRNPLFAFAILWFVAGHLIESTVVPLELYFEHRNYLPLAGPVFALCCFVLTRSDRGVRIAAVALPCYMLVNAIFLHSFASIWGQPGVAAPYWAAKYPDSVRAVTRLASYQLSSEGPGKTIETLDGFVKAHPGSAYLRIQQLNLNCLTGNTKDDTRLARELLGTLPSVDFTYTAGGMLSQLFSTTRKVDCPGIDAAAVAELATALRSNPRYIGDPLYNQFHYKLLAAIAHSAGDDDTAIADLETAISYRPSSELNTMMVTALAGNGRLSEARAFIEEAEGNRPRYPLQAIAWQRDLNRLRKYLDEVARATSATPDDG